MQEVMKSSKLVNLLDISVSESICETHEPVCQLLYIRKMVSLFTCLSY